MSPKNEQKPTELAPAPVTVADSEIEVHHHHVDIVILGCGPAGQKAALSAAKHKKSVAIVEPIFIGGNCTHFGTLPSKTLRESAMHLTNYRLKFLDSETRKTPTMANLLNRVQWVINNEVKTIEQQLRANKVNIIPGFGKFKDKNTLLIYNKKEQVEGIVHFNKAIICSGSRPFLSPDIPYDGKKIFSSDDILTINDLPRSMTIVGGGIIGCEYACIFSILGVKVNLIEKRTEILSLIDREMRANLVNQLDVRKVNFFLGDEVKKVSLNGEGKVEMKLDSGKIVRSETAMICIFRVVNSNALNLDAIGVKVSNRGVIEVNKDYRTSCENIYAAGDVVGAPSLASTSFEQGRIAGTCASDAPCAPMSPNVPIGIYTIPEISYVGPTEVELTEKKIPYQVGKCFFKLTSRGAIMGALDGVLKIMFHQETKKVLAVHAIGDSATELVHVGQAVMELGGTVDYFIDQVFNYPTMAEAYKYAALNGLNRLNDI